MKTIFFLVICFLAITPRINAQTAGAGGAQTAKHTHHKNGGTNEAAGAASTQPSAQEAAAADQARQLQLYQNNFVPTEPWRVVNDQTNFARGGDWVQFEGRVVQITDGGILIQGWFGEPYGYLKADKTGGENVMFNLSNYPRHVAVGQNFSRNDKLVALKAGTKDSTPNLDYGTVYVPQLTDEQKEQLAKAKSASVNKVLAWHKELADKGDPYGEYKMGVRYETGDGVDKDMAKAKDFLTKASEQGNKDATDELAKLPAK